MWILLITLSTVNCKITLAFLGGKGGFSSWRVVAPFSYRSLNWGSPHTWSNLISLLLVVSQASNGLWYQMNDSIVSTSDIRSVLSQQAYVLFYIRYFQESAFPPFLLTQKERFTSSACLNSIVCLNSISTVGGVRKVYLRVGHVFTVAPSSLAG